MKLNQKIVWSGIVLIVVTMICCISLTYFIKLKDPVFLRYCVEYPVLHNNDTENVQATLQLDYITNINDNNVVTGISFPEAEDMSFVAKEYSMNGNFFDFNNVGTTYGSTYGNYSIRSVFVYQNNYFPEQWKGERELNNAIVTFSDGKQLSVNLGKIILYSDPTVDNNFITMAGVSASSDGITNEYNIKGHTVLHSLESALLDSADSLERLKVAGFDYKELSELEFEKDSILTITRKFNDFHNKKSNYDVYDIRPKLYYETVDGMKDFIRIYDIEQKREFYNPEDIIMYLAGRRVFGWKMDSAK